MRNVAIFVFFVFSQEVCATLKYSTSAPIQSNHPYIVYLVYQRTRSTHQFDGTGRTYSSLLCVQPMASKGVCATTIYARLIGYMSSKFQSELFGYIYPPKSNSGIASACTGINATLTYSTSVPIQLFQPHILANICQKKDVFSMNNSESYILRKEAKN